MKPGSAGWRWTNTGRNDMPRTDRIGGLVAGDAGRFLTIDLGAHHPQGRAGEAARVLRSRPGVAVLVHTDPEKGPVALLVGATGDLRAFVGSRLTPGGRSRADLSRACDRVLACEAGSGFEAEAVRAALDPAGSGPVGGWFVRLDPESDNPACGVLGGGEIAGLDAATVIGPFGSRASADAYRRFLDDRFELCREPALLARRPDAVACPYKDMGRCPAACDGSEPIGVYRSRARGALKTAATPTDRLIERAEAELRGASGSLDFERAARVKTELDALRSITGRLFSWATTLDRFGVLAVLPSGRRGFARLMVHHRGRTAYLYDADARRIDAEALCGFGIDPGVWTISPAGACSIGSVCGAIFSRRRTRSTYFRLDPPPDRADVHRAVVRAAGVEFDEPGEPGRRGIRDDETVPDDV